MNWLIYQLLTSLSVDYKLILLYDSTAYCFSTWIRLFLLTIVRIVLCKATAKKRGAIQDWAGHRPEQVEADKRGRQADLELCGPSGHPRQTSDDAGSILAWLGYSKIWQLCLLFIEWFYWCLLISTEQVCIRLSSSPISCRSSSQRYELLQPPPSRGRPLGWGLWRASLPAPR